MLGLAQRLRAAPPGDRPVPATQEMLCALMLDRGFACRLSA
jgi:hypothetical protein